MTFFWITLRFSIIFLFDISSVSESFAQKKLEGKYWLKSSKIIDVYSQYEFSKDGTFTLETGGDLGPEFYGHGKYTLSKDSLILNFSSSQDSIKSSILIKKEESALINDSVEFKFKFYDLENEMDLPATIFKFFEDKSKNKYFQSNVNGVCNIFLPKGKEIQTYTISLLGYESFELELENDSSKTITIGLADTIGKQTLGKVWEFEIEKANKKIIFLKGGDQLIKI
ncbi:hypothetical protein AAGF08_13385 [Algoriphagus sp. SE2]|uniref:hypothetical protein n=1 Tax=Algoriphagus sp. SE2 TaxID=3141536 RepID=UPI0031CD110B